MSNTNAPSRFRSIPREISAKDCSRREGAPIAHLQPGQENLRISLGMPPIESFSIVSPNEAVDMVAMQEFSMHEVRNSIDPGIRFQPLRSDPRALALACV